MQITGKWFGFGLDEEYDAAVRASVKGELEEATALFESATRSREPAIRQMARVRAVQGFQNIAKEAFRTGDFASAIENFEKAVAIHPNFPDLLFGHAQALYASGNSSAARIALERALELNPRYAEALLFLGAIKVACSEPEGQGEINSAFELSPTLRERANSSVEALVSGDPTAIVSIAAMELTNSRDANELAAQADQLAEEGQYEAAVEVFEEAVALAPQYADIRCKLGQILVELDRLEEARAQFEQALTINPRYVEAHAQLGIALRRMQMHDQADAAFKEAYRLDPHHIIAAQEVSRHSWR